MITLHLRFADRAEALCVLAAVLGYDSTAEGPGGREQLPAGMRAGVRYDLCFLADQGVAAGSAADHVNLLWWGEAADTPDFGAHVVTPATPRCGFSA
ncbi:hypothetical protein V5F53_07985 [Xanthobacter sp. V4C-4]|uniref:hypothetical protein n=1 Tax=Xanthobacter cornucopiae TaxID=3119924 RepID=UPI00372C7AC6